MSAIYLQTLAYVVLMVAVPTGIVLGVFAVGVIDLARSRRRRL